MRQLFFVAAAPPQKREAVISQRGIQVGPDKAAVVLFADAHIRGADFLRKAGLFADVTVEAQFRREVHHGFDCDMRVQIAVRGKDRVGVYGQYVAYHTLMLHAPIIIRGQGMHARYDRAGPVRFPDGGGDGVAPVPCLISVIHEPHAVGLVAQLPRGNRRTVLKVPDEAFDKLGLPVDAERVRDDIFAFQRVRDQQPPAHPPGQNTDYEPDIVPGADFRQAPETLHHDRVQPGLPQFVKP